MRRRSRPARGAEIVDPVDVIGTDGVDHRSPCERRHWGLAGQTLGHPPDGRTPRQMGGMGVHRIGFPSGATDCAGRHRDRGRGGAAVTGAGNAVDALM
jgi:hypothetical protein